MRGFRAGEKGTAGYQFEMVLLCGDICPPPKEQTIEMGLVSIKKLPLLPGDTQSQPRSYPPTPGAGERHTGPLKVIPDLQGNPLIFSRISITWGLLQLFFFF